MYTYIDMYTYVCVSTCSRYRHTCMCSYYFTYLHIYVYIHMHICVYLFVYTCLYICIALSLSVYSPRRKIYIYCSLITRLLLHTVTMNVPEYPCAGCKQEQMQYSPLEVSLLMFLRTQILIAITDVHLAFLSWQLLVYCCLQRLFLEK